MAVTYSNSNHWYLFLLSPFLTGILAIKNYKAPWAKNIIWAFFVFYGFTFGMSQESTSGKQAADITRYTREVKDLYKKDLSFSEIVQLFKNNEDIDILRLTLAIGISRFTENAQVLTAIYGLIFGFFYSRNIWFVLDRIKGKIKPVALLLLVAYVLVNPIWNINGFRFNTAVQIFVYGLLPFLFEGKKKGIIKSSLSLFVHFSFLIPIGVLLAYSLLGNRTIIYFAFFIASIFSTAINITTVNEVIDENAPEVLAERTSSYRNEDRVENYREGTGFADISAGSWHFLYYLKALNWTLMALLIFIFFKRKLIEQNKNNSLLNSLSFALLFWGVANIMNSLPSGSRFFAVAALSTLPMLILYIQNLPREKYLSSKVAFASPALLLFIIVSIRVGFYTLSVNTFLANPIIVLVTDYNFSLNDLIK